VSWVELREPRADWAPESTASLGAKMVIPCAEARGSKSPACWITPARVGNSEVARVAMEGGRLNTWSTTYTRRFAAMAGPVVVMFASYWTISKLVALLEFRARTTGAEKLPGSEYPSPLRRVRAIVWFGRTLVPLTV
jgi:hypothetical protein